MERLKERVAHIGQYAVTLLKWMVLGGVIGLVGGIIGSLFHIGVDTATPSVGAVPDAGGGPCHRGAVSAHQNGGKGYQRHHRLRPLW